MAKRKWQEPTIISLEQLDPAYGECNAGSTPVADGTKQCQAGGGASTGVCSFGNGASSGRCLDGQGASVTCTNGTSR